MKRSRWTRRPDLTRVARALGVAALALLVPAGADGQGEPEPDRSQECCLLLLVPVGARASAVGGTLTARAGPDAVFLNPAGLAGLRTNTFVVHHSDMSLAAQIDAFSLLITPFSSTLGISYQLFDKGEITTTDVTGQPIGELSLRDHLLVASFATTLVGGLSGGVSYKLFQQRIDCTGDCGGEESRGTTHAVDFGLRFTPSWHPALELGVALVNLGFPLQMVNAAQADAFPARLHLGVGYDVLALLRADSPLAARVLVDVRDSPREPGDFAPSFGLELDMQRIIFVRAGYAAGEGLGTGAAVGVELRYDRFDVAVARSFVNSSLEADTEPFQVSFGLNF
ncbi:MAG TPA: PorV/PorQ family protein [Longimicrobiales bacterium]|nr:PorV/PorQ family protein [Longimicrobiales bacterium]